MHKVSVIIPTKNRESLLRVTLNNILSQTLLPKEIIVVDDGSTDQTEQMIKKEFSSVVQYVTNNGRGPGAARNTGVSVSNGEFIQFFDSDDLMTPNKLQVQAGLLEKNNDADLVYGPYVMAEETNEGWKQRDVILQFAPLPIEPLNERVAKGWCTITQSCLFRKSVLIQAGPWREDLMPHEDKEYWYRLGKVIRSSLHENQTCVFYRQHSTQITDQQISSNKRTIDGIKAFDVILSQVKVDRVSIFTSTICKGIKAGYVRYLNMNGDFEYRNSFIDSLYFNIYRVYQKIGRMKTRTNWQPADGPLVDQNKFEYFKNLLINKAK